MRQIEAVVMMLRPRPQGNIALKACPAHRSQPATKRQLVGALSLRRDVANVQLSHPEFQVKWIGASDTRLTCKEFQKKHIENSIA
jgi:hypothetical protein